MGSGTTALQKSAETMSSDAVKMMPATSTVSESVKTAATVGPTEREIATVAHQLWLDHGCPAGSDQEYWFQAQAMLKDALAVKGEDLSRPPSIPRRDIRSESEMLAGLAPEGWQGHWEVWAREWVGARWVWDPPGKAA